MRNLDDTNPKEMRPSKFTSFGAGASMVLALICLPLAHGAAPDVAFYNNRIVQLLLVILVASFMLSAVSIFFRWGWKIEYFGSSMICIASVSLFAVVPLLSLLVYGTSSVWFKSGVFLIYVASHIWWGQKFFVIYREIFNDESMREIIYEEEADAIYYNQRGDSYLLEKEYKFSQMPPDRYFIIFLVLSFMLLPIISTVKASTGLPFAHVFLLVAMLPVSWMSLGVAFRGFLICYFYPARLHHFTGKKIYVDLIYKHPLTRKKNRNSIRKTVE